MVALIQDLRLAARHLARAPGFAVVVVLTLALGLGSVTAVYTLIDGVVLRPLPFDEPDRLVHLFGYNTDTGNGRWSSSYPDFEDFRDRSESFSLLAAAQAFPSNVSGHAERPDRIVVGHVTHDLLGLLGTRVILGRRASPSKGSRFPRSAASPKPAGVPSGSATSRPWASRCCAAAPSGPPTTPRALGWWSSTRPSSTATCRRSRSPWVA